MAGSEIQSTTFVSHQPAAQNIYFTTYQNENYIFSGDTWRFAKNN